MGARNSYRKAFFEGRKIYRIRYESKGRELTCEIGNHLFSSGCVVSLAAKVGLARKSLYLPTSLDKERQIVSVACVFTTFAAGRVESIVIFIRACGGSGKADRRGYRTRGVFVERWHHDESWDVIAARPSTEKFAIWEFS